MSISSDWVTACSTALVDRLTNRVSLIHVLEQVQVPRLPAVVPSFHIVALWHNTLDMAVDGKLRIDVEEQSGDTSSCLSEEQITFAGRVSHRTICIVHSMTVQRAGAYRIVARYQPPGTDDWEDGTSHPFHVQVVSGQHESAQA